MHGRPPIDLDRFQRAKALFFDALDLPAGERERFVTERAGPDDGLRAEVLELLRLHGARGLGPEEGPAPLPASIGPYRVLARLGEGGMGVVYRAQRGEEPPVAIKMLAAGVLGDRTASRLTREASVLRRLDHPAIARFIDSGTVETSFGAQPYVVMELVEGVPLLEWTRLTHVEARLRLALIADLCDAIQHAHERAVIHRDLKPSNIMVDGEGRPHILDFGIARVTDSDLPGGTLLTRSGELLGTVRYMSPEQAQGLSEAIDARTDIYSLGVIAYELLADRPPYDLPTKSLTRALVMVATVEPTLAGRHRPALRGAVESILEKALQKNPKDRYESAAAMGADLRRHLSERPVAAATGRLWRRSKRFVRRHRLAVPLAIGLTAALVTAVVTIPWLRHRVPPLAWADLRDLDDRLVAADAPLHVDHPAPAAIDSLLRLHQDALRTLDSYPAARHVDELRQYVRWRIGEACFIRGTLTRDPSSLEQADAWFSRVGIADRPRSYDPALPATFRLYGAICGMTPEQAATGKAIVEAELATYRQPLFHMRRSLGLRASSLGTYARSIGQPGLDPLALHPVAPIEQYGLLLNEYGESLSWVGMLADSVVLIDRGLACFARADSIERNMGDRIAYASLLYNRGNAHFRRLEIAAHPGDLDSAEAFIGAALTIRDQVERPSRVDARIALSRVLRVRARREAGPTRRRTLDDAADQLAAAVAVLERDQASPAACLAALDERAACAIDRFGLLRDPAGLDRAGQDLDRARAGLDSLRAPYPAAWHALVAACLLRARWEVSPTPEHHAAAAIALERARDAMPRDQDRVFTRRILDEAQRLGIPFPR